MRALLRTALLTVVLGGLVGCAEETVAHQQIEREANRILVLLKKSGIDAKKLKDEDSRDLRFNVLVPAERTREALAILEAHNLPETQKADTRTMFEEGGMIPTTEQERAKREVGIQGDIINALRRIPRVVDVQAVVSMPQDDPLRDVNEQRPKPKASVLLVFQGDSAGAPPINAEDVQKFVQARMPELSPQDVSVLLLPTASTVANGGAAGGTTEVRGPPIDPQKGCLEKESVIGIEVCAGNRKKIVNLVLGAVIMAGLLAGLAVIAVLRAMRYRKDLTRLTAQFERVRK